LWIIKSSLSGFNLTDKIHKKCRSTNYYEQTRVNLPKKTTNAVLNFLNIK